MTAEAGIALGVVGLVIGLLVFTRLAADLVLSAGLTLLLTLRILDPKDALAGFANEGIGMVAVLFIVAAGLRETGPMTLLMQPVLGRPRSVVGAQLRLAFPVAAISAFVHNTALTATMLPVVDEWGKRNRLSPSKLMMPLSFAVILGGLCTLIGTSTNLVVNGLVIHTGHDPIGLFQVTRIGLPCCIAGLFYLVAAGGWLLPTRRPVISQPEDPRHYTVEMMVDPGSPLVGQSILRAGLRHLPGLYLME